jgi:NADH-quinone oxidoreductase subunit F
MIIMDDRTCMVDVARYFMSFLTEESCGKCTPCREGVKHLHAILTRICNGKGRQSDLADLEELCTAVRQGSLCGLGTTAPNPVMSTLRYFRDEYDEHIGGGRCRAGVCKALTKFEIDAEKCVACGRCIKACPVGAITGDDKQPQALDQQKCTRCRACFEGCPVDAIFVA